MERRAKVHQFIAGAAPGDAIYDQARVLRRWLVEWGHPSQIYAHSHHPSLVGEIPHYHRYRPGRRDPDLLIYHYSIGSELTSFLAGLGRPIMMVYHNITPPDLLTGVDPQMQALVSQGRRDLGSLTGSVRLALGVSEYNRRELQAAGYQRTGVLPLVLDSAACDIASDPVLAAGLGAVGPKLLFVGRIAPNKRLEDVISAFYHYHLLEPAARLYLVGSLWGPAESYLRSLRALIDHLELQDQVTLTGYVNRQQLLTYYRESDVYLSMSEHEGFGKPLLECMHLNLPVIAFSAAAVPETLGDAGILIHRKHYPTIAELINLVITDRDLRDQLLAGQRRRYQAFDPVKIKAAFHAHVTEMLES